MQRSMKSRKRNLRCAAGNRGTEGQAFQEQTGSVRRGSGSHAGSHAFGECRQRRGKCLAEAAQAMQEYEKQYDPGKGMKAPEDYTGQIHLL